MAAEEGPRGFSSPILPYPTLPYPTLWPFCSLKARTAHLSVALAVVPVHSLLDSCLSWKVRNPSSGRADRRIKSPFPSTLSSTLCPLRPPFPSLSDISTDPSRAYFDSLIDRSSFLVLESTMTWTSSSRAVGNRMLHFRPVFVELNC